MRRAFLRSEAQMHQPNAWDEPPNDGVPTFVAIAIDEIYAFEMRLRMLAPCPHNPTKFNEWKDDLVAEVRGWAARLPVPNVPA
jgi:hypothetical protein